MHELVASLNLKRLGCDPAGEFASLCQLSRAWPILSKERMPWRSGSCHFWDDVLFELQQVVDAYDFHQKQWNDCDLKLQGYLVALPDRERARSGSVEEVVSQTGKGKSSQRKKPAKPRANEPHFDLEGELKRLLGVDLMRIDGIGVMTAQVIHAEWGPDLSAFPNEGAFRSWLELALRRDVSGGKVSQQ